MRIRERFIWWFTGEVAEQAHKTESFAESVGASCLSIVMVTAMLYTGVSFPEVVGEAEFFIRAFLISISLLFALFTAVEFGVLYVYATENTEVERRLD